MANFTRSRCLTAPLHKFTPILVFVTGLLTACGGAQEEPGNHIPVAVINSASGSSVSTGTSITLNANQSSDSDKDLLQFRWTFNSTPAGSAAKLNTAKPGEANFIPDVAGSYVIQLIANDGKMDSRPVTYTVTASGPAPTNRAPVAVAGMNQSVTVGATVTLSGAGSSDPDNNPITYAWTITSKPTNSTATLSNASIVNPTFKADVTGDYKLQLIVNDGKLNSAPSTMTVSASIGNRAPVANAGTGQTVTVGTQITLNGSGSSDPDGNPITYSWTITNKPSASTATLTGPTTVNPKVTLSTAGSYTFQLIVNDGSLNSAASTVTYTANSLPIANAGADLSGTTGLQVMLDGTKSSDPDNNPITYNWTLPTRPTGSKLTAVTGNTTSRPTFTPDVAGLYVAQLIVNDGLVNSTADTVNINVTAPPPPPVVSCESLKPEFQTVTWSQVLKPSCLGCHQSVTSAFNLVPETATGFNDTNFANFKTQAARTGGNNISLMLTKAANLDNNHGGGNVTAQGSAAYMTLSDMVNKTKTCSTGPTNTTGVTNGSGYYRLRKAMLMIASRLPTAADEAAVASAGTNTSAITTAINSRLDLAMTEAAFFTHMQEIYNDMLLTEYYSVGTRALNMDLSNFTNRTYFDSANLTTAGYSSTDANTLRNYANMGISKAPLELVSYILKNNRPMTEIVTANYVMVNSYSAAIFGATVSGNANFAFKYGDAVTAHDPNVFMPVVLTDANSRVYEHAGVLSTLPFLTRYPSTATNRNRARARYTFEFFLDTDVQGLADRSGLNFDNVIGTFPTMQDPQCTVCHDVVDPVAGLYKNWGNNGTFAGNVTNWYSKRNPKEMLDPGYTFNTADLLPGTQSANALQFLGARIATDNRFAVATVKTLLRGMLGEDAANDTVLVEQLKQTFIASNYNMKDLIKGMVASQQFIAVNLGTSENPQNFASVGTTMLSTPEQFDRKITAITGGYQWKSPGSRNLLDLNSYLLLYGGIDSMDVTERTREVTTAMAAIQERIAYQASCSTVPADFAKAAGSRNLFPYVAITDLPDNGTGTANIRKNLQYLHKRVLGEELDINDTEITRAYNLFVAVKAKSTTSNIPVDCAGTLTTTDPIRVDANGTVRSWMAVMSYFLMDAKFLYE